MSALLSLRTVSGGALLLLLAAAAPACSDDGGNGLDRNLPGPGPDDPGPDQPTSAALRVAEQAMVARPAADGGIVVSLPITREGTGEASIRGSVRVLLLDGTEVAAGETTQSLGAGASTLDVVIPAFGEVPAGTQTAGELGGYVLAWRVESARTTLRGRRSLFEAWPLTDLYVTGAPAIQADGSSWYRLVATDARTLQPLANLPARVEWVGEAGTTEVFRGATNEAGELAVPIEAGAEDIGERQVIFVLEVGGDREERVSTAVAVVREQRVMVTTDKPLYQPGQRIHVRALALARPSLRPAADRPATVVVSDGAGNKVMRQSLTTDAFGVVSLEVPLANELNQGDWTISVEVDGVTTERTVRVERYVLPRFNITVAPDRGWYRPGDTALVDLDSQYFFGQPVAGATVRVEPWVYDVDFQPLPALEATLDANGVGRIEVDIPSFLVGQPGSDGTAFVRVDFYITDATGHTQMVSRNLTVTTQDILQTVLAGDALIAGRDARLFVLTRTPVGRAISAENVLVFAGERMPFTTNALGFAEVVVPVPDDGLLQGQLETTDAAGRTARRDFSLAADGSGSAIAVLADRTLYRTGETVTLDILAPVQARRVFVDVIREGQTLLTTALDLTEGRTTYALDLSPDMEGALQISAWYVGTDAQIVRGRRPVYVESADQLTVTFTPNAEEYRPGEEAQLDIRVTDADGQGVVAAMGVNIVDEAVFALQDMRPGLERVYFELETELLEPRFNVYGWSMETVLATSEVDELERETAASVLLAGIGAPAQGLQIRTLPEAITRATTLSRTGAQGDAVRIRTALEARVQGNQFDADAWQSPDVLRAELQRLPTFHDPWGQPWVLAVDGYDGWVSGITAASHGMDEVAGTQDDVQVRWDAWALGAHRGDVDNDFGGGPPWQDAADAGVAPEPSPDPTDEAGGGEGGTDAPRVRSFFPETLLVAPDIITDAEGRSQLTFAMADSITTWRVSGLASSAAGQLGSATAGMRVFQPFFVDVIFPVELTQNDEVSVPVALFNYLAEPQTVQLRVDAEASGDWFTLLSDPTLTVTLAPGEVTVRHFDVRVDRVGVHPFQVTGIGSSESDAVRRVVRVAPDGRRNELLFSDKLEATAATPATVSHTIEIPPDAIEGASNILVRVFPGLFAQVLEGLDSIFAMPSGCFEQTSSATYPNILVLAYLRETDQATPEIELRATEYIAQGYQRLVSYEVTGGGFEWFGNDPAHRILTAYGLLEFTDMDAVYPVDPDLIARTQQWLLAQQESDGRFRAAPEGIHEGATNSFQDSDVRATAYITYALLESGLSTAATDRALAWLQAQQSTVTDAYSVAMIANAYLAGDRRSSAARTLLAQLDAQKTVTEGETSTHCAWGSDSQSLYYGDGESMKMETTALILQAMLRAQVHSDTVECGINYLMANRDSFGNFWSTQATILTLRVFLEQLRNASSPASGTIAVHVGEVLVDTLTITPETSDLMRQVDLQPYVETGEHPVRLTFTGEGSVYYAVQGWWYLPWGDEGPPVVEPSMTIEMAYDRETLEIDEMVTATATVRNRTEGRLDMVMLDLGIPPGFDPMVSDFDAYIADPEVPVSRVERAGRQLTVYVYGLDPGETMTLSYRLRATMAVRAQTPPSYAWLYYQAENRAESAPLPIEVQ